MGAGGNLVQFSIVGRATSRHDTYTSQFRVVTPGYFQAMRIPLLQGRSFSQHDNADSIGVALINETAARRLWPNGDAIGARINIDDNSTGPRPVEVAGIVGNVKQTSLEGDPTFDIYIPMAQIHEDGVPLVTNSDYWVIRSKGEIHSVETTFLREVQRIDRDVATSNVRTMEDYLSDSVAPRRFSFRILTIFSLAALLLAVIGIYGVVSYTVTQRTPEIGIRMALGAGRAQVFRLILGQGVRIAFLGTVFGLAGALSITRVIRGLLFNVTPSDPLTFVFVSGLLIVVLLIACSMPARRATKVDPVIALRNE
jgi:putative ABC transport system permease protein